MPHSFICEKCGNSWQTHRSLRRHYQENESHRPSQQGRHVGNDTEDASTAVNKFMAVPESYRRYRVKTLVSRLSDDEICQYVLPVLCSRVSLYTLLLKKSSTLQDRNDNKYSVQKLKENLSEFCET